MESDSYKLPKELLETVVEYLDKAHNAGKDIDVWRDQVEIDIAKFAHDRYLLEAKEILDRAVDACDAIEFFNKNK